MWVAHLHLGPMRTTALARDGLHRWRDMDAGHRGRAVVIEVGMQIGIQVLFAGLVIFTVVMALVLSHPICGESSPGRSCSSSSTPPS